MIQLKRYHLVTSINQTVISAGGEYGEHETQGIPVNSKISQDNLQQRAEQTHM